MKNRIDRSALSFWTEKEKRIEAAHLIDLCDAVIEDSVTAYTPFLSPSVFDWLEGILSRAEIKYRSVGGFPDPERVRVIIGKNEDELLKSEEKIAILSARPNNPKKKLEHRQVLGSLMGLGIKREHIGDIRESSQNIYVAVTEEIAEFLIGEWKQAGSERIKVEKAEEHLDLPPDPGEERRITVQSSRLDAICASSFNISRTVIKELVTQGKVKRNDLLVKKADAQVKHGDRISCRGYGRIQLMEFSETRKGRIAWNIVLYRAKRRS